MSFPVLFRLPHAGLVALGLTLAITVRADGQPEPAAAAKSGPTQAIERLIDRLPDLLDLGIPGFAPSGAFRLYTHPHISDLIHEDYFRLPVGARYQITEHVELSSELGSYFTHGLGDSVGNGLYQLQVGGKYECELPHEIGAGMGIDFITPLSRPPLEITDGVRHTVPYVSATRTLSTPRQIIGFTSLSADFVAQTHLPQNFRDNELHSNSLLLTVGAAQEWKRFRVILAASVGDTTLLSAESKQVYALRPSLVIPLLRRPDSSARATVTFGGRIVRGPDGTDLGVNTTVRIDLKYRPKHHP